MSDEPVLLPDLQVLFAARLESLRDKMLLAALLNAVASCPINVINEELQSLAPDSGLQRLAGWGLRGEILFATPTLLTTRPELLGYYRLLLGFSQKQFYGRSSGLMIFKTMETRGTLSPKQIVALPRLCRVLAEAADYFVRRVDSLSRDSVHDLTLLTLGPQLRGGALNALGSKATAWVFELIKNIVTPAISAESATRMEIVNAAGRTVRIEFASDPDIRITERLQSEQWRNLVAIEIKGGRDVSNVHNRIGEAEKSHQKARQKGFVECWTLLGTAQIDLQMAQRESPTTNRFYYLASLARSESKDFAEFRDHLRALVGIQD